MVNKLTLKQQEKIFKNVLSEYFLPKGYKYFHEWQNTYFILDESEYKLKSVINGKTGGDHGYSISIAIHSVENIMLELFPEDESKIKSTGTVYENKFQLLYPTLGGKSYETEEDCVLFCHRIEDYMENQGKEFIEKYSYLPNVLAEMDRLEQEGKYWTGIRGKGGILSGMGEAFYRGLIISKLCNDENYNQKVELVHKVFEEDKKWLDGYFLLLKRLNIVTPIYNV